MARPERKNVDYFPHYISDGKKMFTIEHKYGNDGYATWYKILEMLASTENHFLNLSDSSELMFISARCRIEDSKLLNILNDLSNFGEIDSELWNKKIVYSQKFIDSIQDAYSRRNNKCIDRDSLCIHLKSLGITLTPQGVKKKDINPQSKVDETILNKNKEIETRTQIFKETLKPFLTQYGADLLKAFFSYWTEPNQTKTKLKFELEKTWSVEHRLSTWARNDKNFSGKQINQKPNKLMI